MKLLVLTLRYPPHGGSAAEAPGLLARDAVEALRSRGHEVDVLAGQGEGRGDERLHPVLAAAPDDVCEDRSGRAENIEARPSGSVFPRLFRPANYRATKRVLRSMQPDAVLFFDLGSASLAPLLAVRMHGVASLGYVADAWLTNPKLAARKAAVEVGPAQPGRVAVLDRFWAQFRDLIGLGPLFVASESLESQLVASGIARETLDVLPPGLPPHVAREASEASPRPRDAGEPLRVLCASYARGHALERDARVLLEAVGRARELSAKGDAASSARLELTIAGSAQAESRASLVRCCAELGLEAHVRFLELPKGEERRALFARSHVLALPSEAQESSGFSTLEGMAYGLAVVVSDVGASPEMLRDGVEGRVVRAGDVAGLARVLLDWEGHDDRRVAMARVARMAVLERFDHSVFIARLELALSSFASAHDA